VNLPPLPRRRMLAGLQLVADRDPFPRPAAIGIGVELGERAQAG
jgi:hypothetical protein